jgi:glutamate-5-semialdehyde dehydrogenase
MNDSAAIYEVIEAVAKKARESSTRLGTVDTQTKNSVLGDLLTLLEDNKSTLRLENEKDLENGRKRGLSGAMLDRLALSDGVIEAMKSGLREVIALPDPVGSIETLTRRPNNLLVGRMRVPLGVIAMIYESRPNVTVDAAALCLKAGNSVILRGGSEAFHSNMVLAEVIRRALSQHNLPTDCVQVVPTTDRQGIHALLQHDEYIDLVIPRGGEGLIRMVAENSRIPVLKHYKGVCHIYVDKMADLEKATPIIINAKTQRPGVCNALEGLLIHEAVASQYLPEIAKKLREAEVVLVGCPRSVALSSLISDAQPDDWGREFLDLKLCVKVVDSMDEAKGYIATYGSKHTEAIITEDHAAAMAFLAGVDASAVVVNASTRFNDGGELGLGTEIGISTSKLHAYGPMGLEELTTRKFVVFGDGQIRV